MTIPVLTATMSIARYVKKTGGGAGRHGDGCDLSASAVALMGAGNLAIILGAALGGLVFSIAAPRVGGPPEHLR